MFYRLHASFGKAGASLTIKPQSTDHWACKAWSTEAKTNLIPGTSCKTFSGGGIHHHGIQSFSHVFLRWRNTPPWNAILQPYISQVEEYTTMECNPSAMYFYQCTTCIPELSASELKIK
jgi:hypothetical protein